MTVNSPSQAGVTMVSKLVSASDCQARTVANICTTSRQFPLSSISPPAQMRPCFAVRPPSAQPDTRPAVRGACLPLQPVPARFAQGKTAMRRRCGARCPRVHEEPHITALQCPQLCCALLSLPRHRSSIAPPPHPGLSRSQYSPRQFFVFARGQRNDGGGGEGKHMQRGLLDGGHSHMSVTACSMGAMCIGGD